MKWTIRLYPKSVESLNRSLLPSGSTSTYWKCFGHIHNSLSNGIYTFRLMSKQPTLYFFRCSHLRTPNYLRIHIYEIFYFPPPHAGCFPLMPYLLVVLLQNLFCSGLHGISSGYIKKFEWEFWHHRIYARYRGTEVAAPHPINFFSLW